MAIDAVGVGTVNSFGGLLIHALLSEEYAGEVRKDEEPIRAEGRPGTLQLHEGDVLAGRVDQGGVQWWLQFAYARGHQRLDGRLGPC